MSLLALTEAVAAQLEQRLVPQVDTIQVTAQMNFNPTPPAVDLYPADPFQEPDSYGTANRQAVFTVRARVTTADNDFGQALLLDLMDPKSAKSIGAALAADGGFGGACQDSTVEGPSGYIVYQDPGGQGQNLLGCEWRLRTIL